MAPLRDASELFWPAVQETLAVLGTKPEDAAARKIAQQYARVIDATPGHCRGCDADDCGRAQTSAWAMRWLAPLLLDTLTALGATPAARAQLAKGANTTDAKPGGLAKLRAAR